MDKVKTKFPVTMHIYFSIISHNCSSRITAFAGMATFGTTGTSCTITRQV